MFTNMIHEAERSERVVFHCVYFSSSRFFLRHETDIWIIVCIAKYFLSPLRLTFSSQKQQVDRFLC